MPSPTLWSRLRETRLVQALAVYLAAGWAVIQGVSLVSSAFGWPAWVMRGSIALMAAGLVVTMVLVWAHSRGRLAEGEAPPRSRPLLAGAAAVSLVIVGAALWFVVRDRGRSLGPDEALAGAAPGIAILPFSVNDAELARWREGMVDLLATNLDGAAGLRSIDSRTVLARWRERVGEGGTPDLATSLEVAELAGGRYALVGSVVSSGSNMRVLADVYDIRGGNQLGREMVEGSPDSIFSLVDRLSIAVLGRILSEQGGELPAVDLASITTTSVTALKAFLDAEALARRSDFERAIPAYESALAADSTFALADFRYAFALGWVEGLDSERSLQSLSRASRHADRLPERDRESLETALAYYGRQPDATKLARALSQKYPDDAGAWFMLGDILFHLPYQSLAGREDIELPFRRAIALDRTYTPAYIHLLDLAFQWADSVRLAELLPRYDELAAGSAYDERYGITYRLAFGAPDERRTTLAALDTLPVQDLGRIALLLQNPRFVHLQGGMLQRGVEKGAPAHFAQGIVWSAVQRGHIRQALAALESPDVQLGTRIQILAFFMENGIAVPEETVERLLTTSEDSTPGPGPAVFFSAMRALDGRRFDEYRAIEAQIEGAVHGLRAAGDSAQAKNIETALRGLRGRAAMARGETEEARAILETLFRETGFPPASQWLARLEIEAGNDAEAALYMTSWGPNAWAGRTLGPMYEELGERDKALEAYGWVVLAWGDADPELTPSVAAARQSIARLRGLQRG
jgi:TolB-like protein